MTDSRLTDLAWLAGIIDGEGCLSYIRTLDARRPRSRSYYANLSITMMSKEGIEKAGEIMEAKVFTRMTPRLHKNGSFRVYETSIRGQRLHSLLDKILPYLVVKKDQALMLLETMEQCPSASGPRALSGEQTALRDGFYLILRWMKRPWKELPALT